MLDDIDREAMREGQAIRDCQKFEKRRPRNGHCNIRHSCPENEDFMATIMRKQDVQNQLHPTR